MLLVHMEIARRAGVLFALANALAMYRIEKRRELDIDTIGIYQLFANYNFSLLSVSQS